MKRAILAGLGVLLVTATVAAALVVVVDFDDDGDTEQPPPGVGSTGTVLRTSNRSTLDVCIQFVDVADNSTAAAEAVENIEVAVAEVASDPAMSRRGLATSETNVDLGCPAPPAEENSTTVETPSPYLFFVFIVPDEDLPRYLGQRSAPYVSQESMCEGDNCVEVTAGLYFGHSETSDAIRVSKVVRYALGLEDLQSVADSGG